MNTPQATWREERVLSDGCLVAPVTLSTPRRTLLIPMLIVRRLAVACSLLGVLFFTGCRTYGGHGSEEATYRQMQEANRQFADQLERAQADLKTLRQAADANEALQPLAERFAGMIHTHEELLAHHEEIVSSMSAEDSYRALHSAYGTLVTEARLMRKQYNRVVNNVQATVRGTALYPDKLPDKSFYYVEPVGQERMANAEQLTMEEALRGASQ